MLHRYRLNGETVNARASCAEGIQLKTRTGQTLHSVANGWLLLQHLCVAFAL